MKNNMKKRAFAVLTAGFLAITPTIATGLTAFAANDASITINKVTDDPIEHNYYAYPLITGDLTTDTSGNQVLSDPTWNECVNLTNLATELKNLDAVKFADFTADTTPDQFVAMIEGVDPQALSKVFTTEGVLIGNGIELVENSTNSGYTAKDLANGWYLVIDTTEELTDNSNPVKHSVRSANILQVIGSKSMNPKFKLPTLEKKIIENNQKVDANAAAIGDTVTYQIEIDVPDVTGYDKYFYNVVDTLSEGLTYTSDSVTIESPDWIKPTDYYVTETDKGEDGTEIKVVFKNAAELFKNRSTFDNPSTEKIVIQYTATLNEKAKITDAGNPNTAKLVYSNDPTANAKGYPGTPDDPEDPPKPDEPDPNFGNKLGETPEDVVKTYTTGIQIKKVDQDGKPLTEGVEFTLSGTALNEVVKASVTFEAASDGTYYQLKNLSYTTTAPKADGSDADDYINPDTKYKKVVTVETSSTEATDHKITATVDDKGYITFYGLNIGDYKLEETETPSGYNTIKDIEFTISNTGVSLTDPAWSINVTKGGVTFNRAENLFQVEIVNIKGSQLPSTGGIGTRMFYLIGGLLAAGSAIYLITRKRMSISEN